MLIRYLIVQKINLNNCYKYIMDKLIKVETIINLYHKYGNSDYIGESVSQLEHAIQSAIFCQSFIDISNKDGRLKILEDEGSGGLNDNSQTSGGLNDKYLEDLSIDKNTKNSMIVASLLHDIGHLLYFTDNSIQLMENLGVKNHEELGSKYLESLGFNDLVVYLVNSHVKAKRYLISKYPKYIEFLSNASIQTLNIQGNLLSQTEIDEFESHPYYKYAIMIRFSDDYAKVEKSNL